MLKFSATDPFTILWIIVLPVILFIANHTEAKNHPADIPDHNPLLEEPYSSSAEEEIRRQRSLETKSTNDNYDAIFSGNEKGEETEAALGSSDRDELTNVSCNKIFKPLDINGTIVRRNYSSFDDHGKKQIRNSQDRSLDEFATVSPSAEEILTIFNDSFTKIGAASSRGSNRLTLVDFNGPIISQDAESRLDNSEHIRVKRGSRDFDKPAEIRDEDFPAGERTSHDESNVKNELADVYPDLINDPVDTLGSGVELARKKRLNYEMLFPRSFAKSDSKRVSSPPIFFKSFSKSGDSVLQGTKGEELVLSSGETEIGNRYSKRRKKRYAQSRGRTTRRGGPKGKAKSKHGKKHKKKKKRKKAKKPAEIETNKSKGGGSDEVRLFRDKRTVEGTRNLNTSDKSNEENTAMIKNAECGKEELRYYDDVREPGSQTLRDYNIEAKPDLVDKARQERSAAKSTFRQIKKLMEKLDDKVAKLETFVSYDHQGRKRGKKKAEVEDLLDFKNLTKDCSESRVRGDEVQEAESKLAVQMGGRGDEAEEKAAGTQREEKRSTRISRRRESCKKNRIKKRKTHRKWDRWTDWSSCSVTCGKGRQIRWRHCIHDCTSAETEMEEKSCQLPACGPGKFLGIF